MFGIDSTSKPSVSNNKNLTTIKDETTILHQVDNLLQTFDNNIEWPMLHHHYDLHQNKHDGLFILDGVYLLHVKMNVKFFNKKLAHSTWFDSLSKSYKKHCKEETMNDYETLTLDTYLLWIPKSSSFYSFCATAPLEMEQYKTNEVNN